MTAKAVADDQNRTLPTSEQKVAYLQREHELRDRFLKGVLEPSHVLVDLQTTMEMTGGYIYCDGQPEIPKWALQRDPIAGHLARGIIHPSKLLAVDVLVNDEEVLDGIEYIRRAQVIPTSMNACAFDFYARSENWKHLWKHYSNGVRNLVFPQTIFYYNDGRVCAGYLHGDGLSWHKMSCLIDRRLGHDFHVACA